MELYTSAASRIFQRSGPLLEPSDWPDSKDPCPLFDGKKWHLYGSLGRSGEEVWNVLHAIAPQITGPYTQLENATLEGLNGAHVAAPGMYRDPQEELIHMFIQNEFLALGGTVEHLTSLQGKYFKRTSTALTSLPESEEAGIYDPHPAVIDGKKYLVYSGSDSFYFTGVYFVGKPNIFLAQSESNTWYGPWKRMGKILDHNDVSTHHNQLDDPDYEWGLEGPQLTQLPNGKILLSAVCFLPHVDRGKRQRVFFAVADNVTGPYKSLGPILEPIEAHEWESAETGHSAIAIQDNEVHVFYQARGFNGRWRYGIATATMEDLLHVSSQ